MPLCARGVAARGHDGRLAQAAHPGVPVHVREALGRAGARARGAGGAHPEYGPEYIRSTTGAQERGRERERDTINGIVRAFIGLARV